MPTLEHLEVKDGVCTYRPRGRYSLVEAVELVSKALAICRGRGITHMLVDVTGFTDLPIPTLVDRFLMVEDWAQEAQGVVVVAIVAGAEYIHPKKFGVKYAWHLGVVCDAFTTEVPARKWLSENSPDSLARRQGTL